MQIFLSGGSGFLGQHLTRALWETGHVVTAPGSRECDLRLTPALRQFSSVKFDRIFHLAAWTQAGDFCLRHPGEQWLINQRINTNVLEWWQSEQPQAQFIAIGTSCAYDPDLELAEENYLAGSPIESLFTYAMTKRMLYTGLLALQKQYPLRSMTFVPSTLYGSGYHTDGRQMHFIFDLIRKILLGKHCGEPVSLWGDGHQSREIIHVKDFVRLMLVLVERGEPDLVNLGAGEEFTIRQFADHICRLVDYPAERIQYDTSRYVGARSKCLRIDRLSSLIPDLRLTPLEKGLAEVVEWFLAHREVWLPTSKAMT